MQTTDEMLDALAEIGMPRVGRQKDGGWCASIEFPAPKGVQMEVRSDFGHPTHRSALIQLIARLGEVTTLGDGVRRALARL